MKGPLLVPGIPKSFYSAVDFSNFARSGGVEIVPTTLCCSPWSKTLQYGGNVASVLYSGLAAQLPSSHHHHNHSHLGQANNNNNSNSANAPTTITKPFRLCQFSLYFFKPIPMQPLILAPLSPLRVGKKAMHLQASLMGSRSCGDAENQEVARAVGVFMRQHDVTEYGVTESPRKRLPQNKIQDLISVFGEGSTAAAPRIGGSTIPHFEKPGVGFFWAADAKVPKSMLSCKPGDTLEYWMRQHVPVFENQPIDPMHRLLMLGEGSGGLTSFLPLKRYSFVNPMFSMTVLREPQTDWVSVRGRTDVDPHTGSGLVSTTMFDENGICASITQPQIIESWEHVKKPVLH